MSSYPFLTESHSSPNKDAFAIMSEACLCYAQVAYREAVSWDSETLELVYYFTIFIFQFISFIYFDPAQHTYRHQTQQLYRMLLLTFLRWLDSILFEFVAYVHRNIVERLPCALHIMLAIEGLIMQ